MRTPIPGSGALSQGAKCGAEIPHSYEGTFEAQASLLIFNRHIVGVRPAHIPCFPLLSVLR